jgi:TetR/AcrR family transcriptional repressor of mexJK operon
MRPDVQVDLLPCHLMATITGELFMNLMRPPHVVDMDKAKRDLEGRMDLFYHSILPPRQ